MDIIPTGIVRRIDDLGRIIVPKEIRRKLKIKEGDGLEIFTAKKKEQEYIILMLCDEDNMKEVE